MFRFASTFIRTPLASLGLVSLCAFGCTPSDVPADASRDVPLGDAMPPACDGDVICPLDVPYANTSCHTGLSCPYPAANCEDPQTAVCVDERWQIVAPDPSTCLIGGFVPPEPERCRTPFTGTSSGTISVDAGDGFVWGPQGGAMVAVDVLVEDTPMTLTCVEARIDVRIDGALEPQARYGLRLRCGASNGLVIVLNAMPCELRDYAVEVEVEVTGVGSGSTTVMMAGGQTAGLPTCPME